MVRILAAVLVWIGVASNADRAFAWFDESDTNAQFENHSFMGEPRAFQNGSARREVVIIDGSVKGHESLLKGVHRDAEVIVLSHDATIDTVAEALGDRRGIDAIHLVSHGSSGSLTFGGGALSLENLTSNRQSLLRIRKALSDDGDIVLYGCDVGHGQRGKEFVSALADYTGADIAASTNVTGASSLGGDWVLEHKYGRVESVVAFNVKARAAFSSVLQTFDFESGVTDNGNNVTQTVSGVTLTVTNTTAGGVDVAQGNGFGGSSGFVAFLSVESIPSTTFVFSAAVDITSIHVARLAGGVRDIVLSVTDSSGNAAVVQSAADYTGGSAVTLNWTGVTSFEVASTDTSLIRPLFDSIVFTVPNSAPQLGGTPADDSATEDVATAIDLSAYNVSDADGDTITLTLAVDRGTIASIDGNGTTSGVTIANSGTGSMTLQGSAANLNTYLNDTSKITFLTALNDTTTAGLTVTPNDGTENGTADTVNITISAVNDNPTGTGIPGSVTVTEDTQSNVNLGASTFADVDSAAITVTLTASAGTFAQPADGAGVGGGVTETLVSATVITLVGAPADINTYLDTASNIQYTAANNVSGGSAATITVTANDGDGSGNVNLGTVNVNVTAVNDNPTGTGLPASVTVTEDTQSNVDLGASTFADVDSAAITITLTASAGTFAQPADGAGVGGGVTETLVSATVITLVGAPADINTYLDTASNIQYTAANNASGNAIATITVTANDGDGSGNVNLGTVNINVTAVNDNPTATGVPVGVTVLEGTQSNIDLSAATFADVDGDTLTVTLTASAGTFAQPADGAGVGGGVTETLVSATVITLVGAPADINTYLDTASNIQYTSAGAGATITVTINDGAGSGNIAAGTVNINVTAVPPTVASVDVPADGTFGPTQNLDFTVNFSENVTVTGSPQIAITIGTNTRQAVFSSGSGSSALVFRYTTAAGDNDSDGIALGMLGANGGTLRDGDGNDAVLTLNGVASTANILVDTQASTVTITTDSGGSFNESAPGTFTATITFSEAVTGFVDGELTATNATVGALNPAGGSGTVFTATITPAATGDVALDVAAAVAQDAGNNDNGAAATVTVTQNSDVVPTTTIMTDSGGAFNESAPGTFTATVTFSEPVTGFVDGELTATNAAVGPLNPVGGSGTVFTATITPAATGDVNLNVAANVAQDADTNGNTVAAQVTVTQNNDVVPTVVITTDSGGSFNQNAPGMFIATITFSEPVTGFLDGELTATNAAVGPLNPAGGAGTVFTATITPAGTGNVDLDVAANVAQDADGNNNTAAARVTVTENVGPSVEETQQVIAKFTSNRASNILNNQPDLGSFITGSNLNEGGQFGLLAIDGNEAAQTLYFSTSRSKVLASEAATIQARLDRAFGAPTGLDGSVAANASSAPSASFALAPDATGINDGGEQLGVDSIQPSGPVLHSPDRTGSWDIWTEIYGSRSRSDSADSTLLIGYLGSHYFVTNDMLVGVLGQIDWAEESDSSVNSNADGVGWMVGPYLAGRVPGQNLIYEARVAYGTSDNEVSPIGTYTDSFDTTRFIATGKLTGSYVIGDLTIEPSASVAWYEETQEGYADSNGQFIPEQKISIGEVRFGPSVTRTVNLDDGTLLTPSFGVSGVFNFGISDNIVSQGFALGEEAFRARMDAGISATGPMGLTLELSGYYDGVGVDNYDSYGGRARLTIPLN